MRNKKPVIFQISSQLNVGSVGRIAEQIGEKIIEQGWESYIVYGRKALNSQSQNFKIGNNIDVYKHVIYTRLTDKHGLASQKATRHLVEKIKKLNPDIIHLQLIHGYYINIEILFDYLQAANKPVVWTFHDCWAFTGHCIYFDFVNCQKWQTHCSNCPQSHEYPKSFVDRSYENFELKKRIFNSLNNLTIVPVSNWLAEETKKSFLKHHNLKVIHNGIDLQKFTHKEHQSLIDLHDIQGELVILGVANPWTDRKGLKYFVELSTKLSKEYKIILIGLSQLQIKELPSTIIGIERTQNVDKLAEYYSLADVFMNPTLEDTFPTTNLEALACGTPVITFNTGGSPEAIDDNTGFVVEKYNTEKLISAIQTLKDNGKSRYSKACRERAEMLFDKKKSFSKYIEIYQKLLGE
ncbi:MAG: glycosyltransferase [Bacteroidetes bacterium]|nr:glycosyltransferase [Bacteroidota bacterium]